MPLSRQHLPQTAARSINHGIGRGLGTKQTVHHHNGLGPMRRNVEAVVRGGSAFAGPVEEYKPALVGMGRRPIVARSGNEDDQHLSPGEQHPWAMVGDMEPAEIAAASQANTKSLVVGGLAALALGILIFR